MSDVNPPPAAHDTAPGVTRRQALAVGGGLAAAAAVGVSAAPPAAAASGGGETVTLRSVSLEQAELVLREAERAARAIDVAMLIVVVDVCGDVKASHRQDGNRRPSLQLVHPKASTALDFQTATTDLARNVTDPVRQQAFYAAGYTLLGGGVPLRVGDQVIGAVAVGGGTPEQDDQVARAGADALSS